MLRSMCILNRWWNLDWKARKMLLLRIKRQLKKRTLLLKTELIVILVVSDSDNGQSYLNTMESKFK